MAHAKRAMSDYDQTEHWGSKIRIEMSNAKGSGGGGGGGGRGRGRGRGDRGGRGRGGNRSAPYPSRGGHQRYVIKLLFFGELRYFIFISSRKESNADDQWDII